MRLLELLESNEYHVVTPHPINTKVTKQIQGFLDCFKILSEFFGKDRSVESDVSKFEALEKNLLKYRKLESVSSIFKWLDSQRDIFDKTNSARSGLESSRRARISAHNTLLSAFKDGDINKMKESRPELLKHLDVMKTASTNNKKIQKINNPLIVTSNFLAARNGPLEEFGPEDIDKFLSLDISSHKYSILRFSKKIYSSWDHILEYIMNLTDSPKPVRLSKKEFSKYVEYLYTDDADYSALIKKVEDYLHDNNKSLIPEILADLGKYPELYNANEKMKKRLKTLYRGVGEREDGGLPLRRKDVIDQDKRNRYVATSRSSYAARNFALGKGHLDSDSSASHDTSYIIKYSVTPDAIILDTEIFGSVFDESEVLIDATKATVSDVENVSIDRERW